MSSVEHLGLAANADQLAEYGHKLSINFFTHSRRIGNSTQNIDALCNQISSNGAVLKHLSQTLSNDVYLRLCSQEAINIVTRVVQDTKKAFISLGAFVSSDSSSSTQRMKDGSKSQNQHALLDGQTEQIRSNLERFKLSLLLILNVLIFAEQVRRRESLPTLKDQRELVRVLATEKVDGDDRYTGSKPVAPQQTSSIHGSGSFTSITPGRSLGPPPMKQSHARAFSTSVVEDRFVTSPIPMSATSPISPDYLNSPNHDLHSSLKLHYERIQHHSILVDNLLSEISSPRYKLDHGIRHKLHNGVLDLHWNEWSKHRSFYGQEIFDQMLVNHEEIARYWTDQLMNVRNLRYLHPSLLPPYEQQASGRTDFGPDGGVFGLGIGSPTADRMASNFNSASKLFPGNVPEHSEEYDPGSIDNVLNTTIHPLNRNMATMSTSGMKSRREPSVTLQNPWHSQETGERRPSIEVTAPDYFLEEMQQSKLMNDLDPRVRPTVSIPTGSSSPGTSGAQTPILPSDLTLTRKLSYERIRTPTSSTQTSPAISPALRNSTPVQNSPIVSPKLRQATLNSARATNTEPNLPRTNSRTGGAAGMRPRAERASSSTYDEELLSPNIGRKPSVKDKPHGSLKLIDPLGRKFKCPLEKCSTWEDMHNLIQAQFNQHPDLFPEVHADEYDLFLTDGQRVPIADWAHTACAGLRITMLLRFGKPETGSRRKDCLIPYDGDHILAPDMLHYITKREPHNAYRTKLIPGAVMDSGAGAGAAGDSSARLPPQPMAAPQSPAPSLPARDKFAAAENMLRQTSDPGTTTAHQRKPSRSEEPSLFSLDEVDRLVLRLTMIRQSELKMINWAEEAKD